MITIADLNVGDRVGVCFRGWDTRCELKAITRKTATQIVLEDGTRWTKYGRKVGEGVSYHASFLVSEDDAQERIAEYKAKAELQSLLRTIRDADYKAMPVERLRQIAALVKLSEAQRDGATRGDNQ